MAVPTTREDFKEFCLRQLGKPVINIDCENTQIEDKIDLALEWYQDYHADATEIVYYKHQLTDQDRANQSISMPDSIIGVTRVFPIGSPISGSDGLFDIQYQIALNDLYNLTSVSMVPYFQMRQHLELLEMLIIGQIPIRYNRNTNILHLDMNMDKLAPGNFVLVECTQIVDPDTYSDIWKDRWLIRYATALIKQQWGNNTKKYNGAQLPGGITFTGQQIYDEATQEIAKIESEMLDSYSLPADMFMG